MCERCWGKAFTAAYGIGSKTQAGEYKRIVASCECTQAQRLGVADSFAEGYTARNQEVARLSKTSDELRLAINSYVLEIATLREEVEDWRESARKAAQESCGDEVHCTCVGPLRARVAELEAQLDRTRLPLWILKEDIPIEEIRQCAKECKNTWPEEGIADDARFVERWLATVKG